MVPERTAFKHVKGGSDETDSQLAVNMRVRVYPGTQTESRGVIVEDLGEMAAQPVEIGGQHAAGTLAYDSGFAKNSHDTASTVLTAASAMSRRSR